MPPTRVFWGFFDGDIEMIRNEFGALEAPGEPEDNEDPDEHRDLFWERLLRIVEKIEVS